MKLPTLAQAEAMLREAEQSNPGPWADHSRSSGENARLIAEHCAGLDGEAACVMGMLHDIGRRYGFGHMKHTTDGYHFLMDQGYEDAAMICLTHSFPLADVRCFMGKVDVPKGEYELLKRCLEQRPYTEYDRLIQLCDALSVPGGGVLIEKRLMDVAMRHGSNPNMLAKWKATFDLKDHFAQLVGQNIYKLLPRIVENTFEW